MYSKANNTASSMQTLRTIYLFWDLLWTSWLNRILSILYMITDDDILHNIRSSFHLIGCRQIRSMLDSAFGIRVQNNLYEWLWEELIQQVQPLLLVPFEPVFQTVFRTSSVTLLTLSKIVAGISRYRIWRFRPKLDNWISLPISKEIYLRM